MAPSSPASQPPFDRSDVGQREKQSQHEQAEAPEVYGPLGIERHVKDDDRVLILYTRREREDA